MGVSIYRVKEPEGVPKYWAYVMEIGYASLELATLLHCLDAGPCLEVASPDRATQLHLL